jgi:cell division protein FtsB
MGRAAARIRWDRLGRVALLLVLVGVIALYVNPLRSYLSTWSEAKHRRAEVAELQRENQRLRARKAELRNKRALEREARRLGMVKPGERAYVVEGLR